MALTKRPLLPLLVRPIVILNTLLLGTENVFAGFLVTVTRRAIVVPRYSAWDKFDARRYFSFSSLLRRLMSCPCARLYD